MVVIIHINVGRLIVGLQIITVIAVRSGANDEERSDDLRTALRAAQ